MKKHVPLYTLVLVFAVIIISPIAVVSSPQPAVHHTVAIRTDGSLWGWGINSQGQLGEGDGANTLIFYPMQIGTDRDWKTVAAGSEHTVAIKTDGSLWAWGANNEGQVGNGTTNTRVRVPTQIGSDTDWVDVSAGEFHTMGIRVDGSLWAWGSNQFGQLGTGSSCRRRHTPTQIGSDTDWHSVPTGVNNTVSVKSDGSLWGWGVNFYGSSVGYTSRIAPIQFGADSNWAIAATSGLNIGYHSVAVKTDGSVWTWGSSLNRPGSEAQRYPTQIVFMREEDQQELRQALVQEVNRAYANETIYKVLALVFILGLIVVVLFKIKKRSQIKK